MRRRHHHRYQGLFTRLASLARSLASPASARRLLALAALLVITPAQGKAQSAAYRVTFEGRWTTAATPDGVPGGAHFSPLIGAVHNDQVTFWREGGTASTGIESMAEVGGTNALKTDITAAGSNAGTIIERIGNIGATATVTADFTVTSTHPLVTLLTMVAPSPDRFVGVSGLTLLDAQGDWLALHTVDLFPYDAGTEEGTEFLLSNAATSPRGTITSIKGTGKFSDEPIASLTFTLQAVAPEITSAATFPVDEGTTAVATLTAEDQDSTAADLAWSKAGGADADQFMLSTSGSVLPAGPVDEAQTLVRGPYLQSGTSSSVIVKWRSDEATDSVVHYGLAPDSLTLSATNSTSTTEHAVQLTGLSADVKVFYSVGTSSVTLAGGDSDHFVVTAPDPGTAKPTRIWVIGDSGTADNNARAVRDAFLNFTESRHPDLWIMLGDNAYHDGTDNEYRKAVFNTYPQVLPRTVLWPTLGNHDGYTADSTTESGPYYDIFSLPRNGEAGGVPSGTEAYYSFDYGNMHFICLDSYGTDHSPDGAMMTWLERDLAANDKEWVIAFWHHPPYSKGSADSDEQWRSINLRWNAVPILEQYGVDLVLTGHSHSYERSYLIDGHYELSDTFTDAMEKNPGDGSATGDGTYQKPAAVGAPHAGAVYVVAGNAGLVKPGGSLDHPAMAVSIRTLGSMVLDVNGSRLDAMFLDSTGTIRDDFTILKFPEVSGRVAENTAADEGVVAVAGEHSEEDLNYTLAGANGNSDHTPFTITAQGELQTNSPLDFEQPADADGNSIYEVVVSVEDGEEENGNEAGTDDSILVTIHVTDMDEAGTVSLPPDPPQALTPLTARLDDPDRDAGHTVSWQWASSANRTGPWTAIGGATAPSYTPQASDVTKYLRATATYQDRHARNQSAFSDASAQVTAHAQSVAPEITSETTFTVDEGTTAVETLTANDQDSAAADLAWSKAGGADAGQFMLSAAGDLAFAAAPDYESPGDADGDRTYEITVQVSDGDHTDTADIRVTLQNVLELFTELEGPSSTDYAENGAVRVAAYIASSDEDRDGITWHLSGDDDEHFSIDNPAGVLRFHIDPDDDNSFPKLPDYEMPDDKDANNAYAVTVLAQAGSAFTLKSVFVTVTDENEAGAIWLSTVRPKAGSALTATLTDPDGVTAGTVMWQWERSTGPNAWVVIAGEEAASYMPTAADTNAFLRVTSTYDDEHDLAHSVQKVTANVVTGPLLTALEVTTDAATATLARAMNPAFGGETLHYAIGCNGSDTMRVTLRAPSNARVAVDGRVPSGNSTGDMTATVEVTPTSDVPISVTDRNGAHTVYHVHCLNAKFYEIEAGRYEDAEGVFEGLLLFHHAGHLVMMDSNGVPRFRETHADARSRTWFFRVGPDEVYRYAYATWISNRVNVLDQHMEVIDEQVSTVFPLRNMDPHDFVILPNGNYLLMSYERKGRNLSHLTFTDAEGNPYHIHSLYDSAIQIITPDEREALFTWNSWGNMPLGDCVQHRFARSTFAGYAHLNSLQLVGDHTIVGSFRGCSKVLGIDVATGSVKWRVGRTNLSDDEWASRDIGPAPIMVVNDPEGEFCGQHSATLLPNGHLLLFDNGAVCLIDPWKDHQPVGTHGEYSRAVEYALDLDAGEAVFVRDHSLHGNKAALGYSSGQVVPMDNGDWLISWGRNQRGQPPLEETVTQVDPATGQEKFFIRFTEENTEERPSLTASPVPADALADTPGPLTAEIVESPASSLFHLGPADAPKVAVAFSRPVVNFAADTTSVSLTGATIAGISPHVAPGDPANAYLFTLTPTGVGPITFAPVAGQPCASGGICTADGTVLTEVRAPHVISPRTTGPAVASITSSATHPTKDGFTVTITFSEPVTGLTANEIEVTNGTGSNFGGSGESYTLEIAPDAGIEDEVTVTVTAGAVVDGLNNGSLQASEAFPVDTKAPTVSTIAITSNTGTDRTYAAGDEMEVTVTFSETVEVTGTPRLQLELGGGVRTAAYRSGTGTAALVFAYEVAYGERDADGVSIEADSLSRNGGTIQDEADNDAVLDHDGLAADAGHKVDAVKPELAVTGGAVVEGTTLKLTYDEPLDAGSVAEPGDFTVAGGDHVRTVIGVRVNGSTVELTLDSEAEHEEAGIQVSYTPGMNRLRDVAGNEAEGLSRRSVTNETPDTTAPLVSSLAIGSNPGSDQTYAAEDEIQVTVTFSETVEVEGAPRLRLRVGIRNRTAGYLRGADTAALVFGYEVADGDEDTDGVSIEANRLTLNGGTIKDEGDNPAELAHEAVAAQAGHQVDGVRPAFVSAAVDGSSLTLTYGEALDEGSRPASGDFTVTVDGSGRSVSGVSVSGSVLTLFLNPAVEHGDTGIRVSYTQGTNPLRDAVGNEARGLSNRSVTNTTGAPNTAPEITSPGSFDVPENQSVARRLAARDTDAGDEVTGWDIVGGSDQGQFSIASDTGELSFRDPPDYEAPRDNQYAVTVEVRSGAGAREMTAAQTLAVRVTDEREPPGVPEAPTFSGETADSLTVSWSEPENTGPPITDYDVQYREKGTGRFIDGDQQGPGRTLTLTDLEPGTVYEVQLRARNEEGTSGWSDPGEGMTVAPLTLVMAGGTDPPVSGPFAVRFSFSEPVTGFSRSDVESGQDPACVDDQNNPVFCDPGIGTLQTTDDRVFTTTVTPWTDRVAHSYTLRLTVAGGAVRSLVGSKPNEDPEEPLEVRVAPPGVEEPISSIGLGASSGSGSVRLSWNRPSEDGGAAIIRYEVRYQAVGEAWSEWENVGAGARGVTVGNLINGREYVFEVRAVNALGKGGAETVQATPERRIAPPPPPPRPPPPGGGGLLFPPEAPAALMAMAGEGAVRLEWGPPASDGGTPILRYEYRLKEGRGEFGEWTPIPDSAPDEVNAAGYTVGELGNGTVYVFELRAVNLVGEGRVSEAVEVVMGLDPAYWSNFGAEDLQGSEASLEHTPFGGTPRSLRLRFGADLRFEESELDGDGEVTATRSGGYGYRYTSRTTGELSLDYDGGDSCELRLTFRGVGAGSYSYRCGGRLGGQGSFRMSGLNRAPEITGAGVFEVAENRTRVGQLEAVDPDEGDEIEGYGITGGADAALFAVVEETGELLFREAPDYEDPGDVESAEPASGAGDNEYIVVVEVSSGEGERERRGSRAIRVRVSDEEEPPEITSVGPFEVVENQTMVGQLEAVDQDKQDEIRGYGIAGGADEALFAVVEETGELLFREAPDYENPGDVASDDPQSGAVDNEYIVVVEVRSGEGERERKGSRAIRVRVADEEEPPGAPAAPAVTAEGSDSLKVSWREPENRGPEIMDYEVRYREAGEAGYSDGGHQGTGLMVRLSGLKEGTSYEVQVRAVNEEGMSEWSEPGEGRTDREEVDPDDPSDFSGEELEGRRLTLRQADADGTTRSLELRFGEGNRFEQIESGGQEAATRSEGASRSGSYSYEKTGPGRGTVRLAYDDGSFCEIRLSFAGTGLGGFAYDCGEGDQAEGSFRLTTGSLFVPVILSAAGQNQSLFTSELTLTNRGEREARLHYTYTAHIGGGSGRASDVLAPGKQKIETDALVYLQSLGIAIPETGNRIGTLRVEARLGSEVEAVVRTTTAVVEGRAGLAYLGVGEEEGFQVPVYLCGLRQNGRDRSNLAFQNMGAPEEGAITMRTTVYSGESGDTTARVLEDVKLEPGGFHQYSGLLGVLGVPAQGYVRVERVEGTSPFYAYGVINDQANSDGSFVFPVAASSLEGRRGQTLPVMVETSAFTSELTVTNFSEEARTLQFSFVAGGVETPDRTADFTLMPMRLEAGEQRIIPDIVAALRQQGVEGIGPSRGFYTGAVFATAEGGDMSGIVIGARTGSQGGGGQYSVFYNAAPFGEAFTEVAWVDGLQQNGENRSNLALVNTGEVDDSASVFSLEIYDGETGLLVTTIATRSIPARGWHQINGILGSYAPETRQGYIRIRKVSGENPFLAYGVVNDGGAPGERSGDGAYLPARE